MALKKVLSKLHVPFLPLLLSFTLMSCNTPSTPTIQAQLCPSSVAAGTLCTIDGIEFAAIPGGEFAMGDGSDLALPNEQPVHEVTVDGFWMAKTELTFKQWNEFIATTGYPKGRSQAQGDDYPVVSITWEDAKAYCDWFSQTYGVVARLPPKRNGNTQHAVAWMGSNIPTEIPSLSVKPTMRAMTP